MVNKMISILPWMSESCESKCLFTFWEPLINCHLLLLGRPSQPQDAMDRQPRTQAPRTSWIDISIEEVPWFG